MATLLACCSTIGLIMIQLPQRFPHIQFSEKNSVADIIVDNGWHIPCQLPSDVKDFLSNSTGSISIGENSVSDLLSWQGNSTGNFSLREAWHLLRSKSTAPPWSALIWSKFSSPRVSCLSWRLLHGKTATYFWAKVKGWSLASRCYNCFNGEETDLHLFFSCKLAQSFWQWLLSPCASILATPLCFYYLEDNCHGWRCLWKEMCCSYLLPCHLCIMVSPEMTPIIAPSCLLWRKQSLSSWTVGTDVSDSNSNQILHPILITFG